MISSIKDRKFVTRLRSTAFTKPSGMQNPASYFKLTKNPNTELQKHLSLVFLTKCGARVKLTVKLRHLMSRLNVATLSYIRYCYIIIVLELQY